MADKLTETQLGAILAQQIELAKSAYKADRQQSHDKELDYYFGRMDAYVPPEPNRSKVVSRDVADTIGWLLPSLMRIFTASGRMFVAEPVEADDVNYAEEATDGINAVFWKDNKGYELVYDGTWDALLHGDAIVKTFWDDAPVYGPSKFHDGLTEDQLAMLVNDDAMEVLQQTERTAPMQDAMSGAQVDTKVYDIKARRKKADGRVTVTVIPPEDFLIDSEATCLEDAAFKAHWERKTRSDLVQMGYDKADIWTIPAASRNESAEAQARRAAINGDATDQSMELVDYFECYPMIDADGDGVAEMLRCCYAGGSNGKLLDWEVWEDEDPFDNIRCEPIPHRWDSRSVADKEIDIQDVKTVLTRQLLNNTYWVNNPQRFAKGKILNMDELQSPSFGGVVQGGPDAEVVDLVVPYIGDKAMAGLSYMDEMSARRTGVNSQSMALDPETLQNQSATANQNAMDASHAQPEQIARNMAEGWGKVGRKMLRLMNRHMEQPSVILVKGKPTQIDPRSWNPDMHVNINTGLGTGSRDRDAGMLNTVLQQQMAFTDRIGAVFPAKALDMLPYIHNTLTRFAESTGLKNPELYWPDIDPQEIEQGKQALSQPKPDPQIAIEQAKGQVQLQLKQADVQSNAQIEQGRQQTQQQLNALESQRQVTQEQAQMQADLATREADRQNALQLEQVKQQGAYNIEAMRIASQERMKAADLAHQAAQADASRNNAMQLAAMKPQPGAAAN